MYVCISVLAFTAHYISVQFKMGFARGRKSGWIFTCLYHEVAGGVCILLALKSLVHYHAICIDAFVAVDLWPQNNMSDICMHVRIYIHVGSENSQETSQSQLKEEFENSKKSLMSALSFIQKKQMDEEKEEVASLKSTIYMYRHYYYEHFEFHL